MKYRPSQLACTSGKIKECQTILKSFLLLYYKLSNHQPETEGRDRKNASQIVFLFNQVAANWSQQITFKSF